jgi:hypothetical protein
MSFFAPDTPYGAPAFGLSDDQLATVINLICRGVEEGRAAVTPGMLEVPATQVIRKAMKRVKRDLGLTNLQVMGELELDDMATDGPGILGRIDIILQFMHQFGDETAYVAIECKRVDAGDGSLNSRYVTDGVDRFATGKYAAGHQWGFMLGYVLSLPAQSIIDHIDARIRQAYGEDTGLVALDPHPLALAVLENRLLQSGQNPIRLKHILVDLTAASKKGALSKAQVHVA